MVPGKGGADDKGHNLLQRGATSSNETDRQSDTEQNPREGSMKVTAEPARLMTSMTAQDRVAEHFLARARSFCAAAIRGRLLRRS